MYTIFELIILLGLAVLGLAGICYILDRNYQEIKRYEILINYIKDKNKRGI